MASSNDRAAPARGVHGADDLSELRTILIGPEARELEALRARIDDREARAAEVADVLPDVLVQQADDPRFVKALSPPIERAITGSVQQNPEPLAQALFPVMGPAIRKAVAASLAGLVESFNRTLEHAVSWRSLRWRLEALRTHRSFAEVVLLKTLVYRVEQLFLIDRRTGLLLLHVQPGTAAVTDADMVSGMLTAIRDFVHDSFDVHHSEVLEALQVGDLNVWIEAGPKAMLAAVIRGSAPRAFRDRLTEAMEDVHRRFCAPLETFDGDVTPFGGARPILEACLASDYRNPPASRGHRLTWIVAGVALFALAVWIGLGVRQHARHATYLAAVEAEPGLTVIDADRRGGRLVVTGLRDPRAADPAGLLGAAGLVADDVEGHWAPYQSLEPPLVLARARQALQPPDGVVLAFDDGVLSASGDAPPSWLVEAKRVAPVIGGVDRFDAAAAIAGRVAAIAGRLARTSLLFATGSTRLVAGQDAARETLVAALVDLDALAAVSGGRFTVVLRGHADLQGAEASNERLSLQRAETVRALLPLDGLAGVDVAIEGVGSRDPVVQGDSADELQPNRRVSVQVVR